MPRGLFAQLANAKVIVFQVMFAIDDPLEYELSWPATFVRLFQAAYSHNLPTLKLLYFESCLQSMILWSTTVMAWIAPLCTKSYCQHQRWPMWHRSRSEAEMLVLAKRGRDHFRSILEYLFEYISKYYRYNILCSTNDLKLMCLKEKTLERSR